MADNKTCGNCASYYEVRPIMGQGSCFFDELDEYGCSPLHDLHEEACENCEPKTITAEERCQQLEELAREMWKLISDIEREYPLILDPNRKPGGQIVYPRPSQEYAYRLEELGVIVDG